MSFVPSSRTSLVSACQRSHPPRWYACRSNASSASDRVNEFLGVIWVNEKGLAAVATPNSPWWKSLRPAGGGECEPRESDATQRARAAEAWRAGGSQGGEQPAHDQRARETP